MEYSLTRDDDKLPIAKKIGSRVTLKLPFSLDKCIKSNSLRAVLYNELKDESVLGTIKMDLYAILVDPSDGKDYDWTSSPYPFPGEKLDELKTTILRKEFQITANVKSDEVQNARVDNIRYHENTNLEQ